MAQTSVAICPSTVYFNFGVHLHLFLELCSFPLNGQYILAVEYVKDVLLSAVALTVFHL